VITGDAIFDNKEGINTKSKIPFEH